MKDLTPTLESNSRGDDDPLGSGTIILMTAHIELMVASSGRKGIMTALLDYGCTMCPVSPSIAEKLRMHLRQLKTSIVFSQLDGTLAGGGPTSKPVEMRMGPHKETINFIIAPGMDHPMVLGLAWLEKWNPSIDWRKNILNVHQRSHGKKAAVKVELCSHMPLVKKVNGEGAASAHEQEDTVCLIPKEYWALEEDFSECKAYILLPHRPTDCAIEILPGTKLPKPRHYSMTPRELEFHAFIDKNLARGCIQPVKSRMAAPVLF